MATSRKQHAEVERLRKKVVEGVELFEATWLRAQQVENRAQRKRGCAELKKEVKKLRRLREQVRAQLATAELRDRETLDELRRLAETQMERYERFERQMLAKAFSTATLSRACADHAHLGARAQLAHWLDACVDALEAQMQRYDLDAEVLRCARRPLSRDACARLTALARRRERHAFHIAHLTALSAKCADPARTLDVARIQRIRDDVDHYVASSAEPDFQGNELLYDDLDLEDDLEDVEGTDCPDAGDGNEGDAADDSREESTHALDSGQGRGDGDIDTKPSESSRALPIVAERLELKASSSDLNASKPNVPELQLELRATCSSHGPSEPTPQPSRSKSRSGVPARPSTTLPERRPKSPELVRSKTPERWDEEAENSPRPVVTKLAEVSTETTEDMREGPSTKTDPWTRVAKVETQTAQLSADVANSRVTAETKDGVTTSKSGKATEPTPLAGAWKTRAEGGSSKPAARPKGEGGKARKPSVAASWTHAQRSEVFLSWLFQDYMACARSDERSGKEPDPGSSWFSRLPPVDITYFTRSPSATDPVAAWHAPASAQPMSDEQQWRAQRLADSYWHLQRSSRQDAEPGDAHAWSAERDCMH